MCACVSAYMSVNARDSMCVCARAHVCARMCGCMSVHAWGKPDLVALSNSPLLCLDLRVCFRASRSVYP